MHKIRRFPRLSHGGYADIDHNIAHVRHGIAAALHGSQGTVVGGAVRRAALVQANDLMRGLHQRAHARHIILGMRGLAMHADGHLEDALAQQRHLAGARRFAIEKRCALLSLGNHIVDGLALRVTAAYLLVAL